MLIAEAATTLSDEAPTWPLCVVHLFPSCGGAPHAMVAASIDQVGRRRVSSIERVAAEECLSGEALLRYAGHEPRSLQVRATAKGTFLSRACKA